MKNIGKKVSFLFIVFYGEIAWAMQAVPHPSQSAEYNSPLPALYSQVAIKKIEKESFRRGYAQGMQDGNQVIAALDAQRQEMLNHNRALQENATNACQKLEKLIKSISPHETHFMQLQEILALLEKTHQSS